MAATHFAHQTDYRHFPPKAPGGGPDFCATPPWATLNFCLLTSLALFNLGVGYWGAFAIHAARMGRIAARRHGNLRLEMSACVVASGRGASWRCLGPARSSGRPHSLLLTCATSTPISFARGGTVSSHMLRKRESHKSHEQIAQRPGVQG